MVIVDGAGAIVLVNAQAERLFGYRRAELLGRPVELLVPDRQGAAHASHRVRFAAHPATRPMGAGLELHARRKDGREIPVEISLSPLETDEGPLVSAAVRDISERKQIERANRRLAAIVQSTPDAILATERDGTITEWNKGAETLYGYPAEEAIGRSVAMLMPPERAGEEQRVLSRVLRGETMEQFETSLLRKDGSRVDVAVTISPIREPGDAIGGAALVARDVSERKRFEGQLQHLADHDTLTGLFNRRRFEEELTRELARARRYGTRGAVLALDLDHFKLINDSLGHAAGDDLITRAGTVLRGRLRATDVLARMGGDEFAVILPGVDEAGALGVAGSLLDAARRDCTIDTPAGPRNVTASIGIATYSGPGERSGADLLIEADIAMYDAKEAGRDRASVYDSEEGRHERIQARIDWAERIRAALRENRFVLHAQPILPLDGDVAPRHELLLRMVGDDGELVPPAVFLPIAERMGLIRQIDRWVLREGIRLLAREQARDGADVRLEVNVSAMSATDPDLPGWLGDELEEAGADGRGLCLEITETAAIVNVRQARTFAAKVRGFGCEFALDDFGAGFASFYYLKHLLFDYLKIDGEFIAGLTDSTTDQLVVRSMVEIAHGLGKRTIAEFVGDAETLALLRRYGIDYAQGFYVAEPKPLAQTDLARSPAGLP